MLRMRWMSVVLALAATSALAETAPVHAQVTAFGAFRGLGPEQESAGDQSELVQRLQDTAASAESRFRAARELNEIERASECRDAASLHGPLMLTKTEGRCFWGSDDISALNLGNVTANADGGSIYADLLTTFFGPVRVNLGTMVAAADPDPDADTPEEEPREVLQRLMAGGGNLLAGAQVPVLNWSAPRLNGLSVTVIGLGRGATALEALGSPQTDRPGSAALAGDLRIETQSDDGEMELLLSLKAEKLWGGAEFFLPGQGDIEAAGLEPQTLDQYVQLTLGARLWKSVFLAWTRYQCDACDELGMQNQLTITAQRSAP